MSGTTLRVPAVAGVFIRLSPVFVPSFGFKPADIVAVLEKLCAEAGNPRTIRVGQGSECVER